MFCRVIGLLLNVLLCVGMYHGFDWYGRTLEVREVSKPNNSSPHFGQLSPLQDRYAGLSGSGGFRGGLRGGPRGLGRGLRGGPRGGFRGGYSQAGGGRDFSNSELYADYSGPDQQAAPGGGGGGGGLRMDGYGGGGGYGAGAGGGFGGPQYAEGEPSQQIMVRNVWYFFFLGTKDVFLIELL